MKPFHICLFIIGGLMLCSNLTLSQSGWVAPMASNYSLSASVTAIAKIDGITQNGNSGDQIAFFYNGQIRGLANAAIIPGIGTRFFVTLYSNLGNLTYTIKIYKASINQILDASNAIQFIPQSTTGSFAVPFEVLGFSNNDAPIDLLQIPPQFTMSSVPFQPLRLKIYLVQTDNDPIVWAAQTNPNLNILIQNDTLFVSGKNNFVGQTSLRIIAKEQTVNQYRDSIDVVFNVTKKLEVPKWKTHPSQGTKLSTPFESKDLFTYEDEYDGNCLKFDYIPVLTPIIPNQPSPNWIPVTNLQATMNIVARVRYTPKYFFEHPNDKLAAFINNQVRGVSAPAIALNGPYFFLTVNNLNQLDSITFKFYSFTLKQVIDLDLKVVFSASGILGTIASPIIFELTPLTPVISNTGILSIQKTKTNWVGEQSFSMIAYDCNYPVLLSDTITANFCVSDNSSTLDLYFKDFDNDGYSDDISYYQCYRPVGFKLKDELIYNDIDCNDDEPTVNIITVVSLRGKCYPTIWAAINKAKAGGDTILIHSNLVTIEDNTLPLGYTIKALPNANWTISAIFTNRGKINMSNTPLINGPAGVFKGNGTVIGNFQNFGKFSPGG